MSVGELNVRTPYVRKKTRDNQNREAVLFERAKRLSKKIRHAMRQREKLARKRAALTT